MAQKPSNLTAASKTSPQAPDAALANSASKGKEGTRKADSAPERLRKRLASDVNEPSADAVHRLLPEAGRAEDDHLEASQDVAPKLSGDERPETELTQEAGLMDTSLAESSSAEGFVNPGPNWNSTSQTWQLAQAGAAAVASDAAAAGAAASSATTAATTAATATAGAVGQTAGLLLGVGAATAAVLALQERDTTAPKVTAVVDDSPAELANGDIAFTVTFDEALTGTVGTNNFSATNGTVTSVTRVGSSNAYTVVVTPNAGLASGNIALSLIGAGLADAAGNVVANADLSGLASQAVDTLAPTLAISSDVATLSEGQTALITFTFSEDPGTSFGTDDVVVTGGALGAITGNGLTRTATFTPAADQTGVNASITVAAGRYTDAAANNGLAAIGPSISLETRTPLLNHHVAALAWRLPMTMKIRGGQGKWALRQILYKHVPRHLIERPKAGFGMPIGQWLHGPLREWAEDLLEPGLMQRQGYLRPEAIQIIWRQHLSGRFDHTSRLWTVLMWQAWLAEWG